MAHRPGIDRRRRRAPGLPRRTPRRLRPRRPERAGATDGELILRAYERWGEDCPRWLYGDYAFALWDSGKRLLFCARDAVGVRPFFYVHGPGADSFSRAIPPRRSPRPAPSDDLDEAQAAAYLMGRPMGAGGTFFRSVRSLPPGHSIAVGAETERVRRWWRPEDAPPVVRESDEDYEREFLDVYSRAVRERLRDARPLGVHLSGGLDSSSVAVLAARELRPFGTAAPRALLASAAGRFPHRRRSGRIRPDRIGVRAGRIATALPPASLPTMCWPRCAATPRDFPTATAR